MYGTTLKKIPLYPYNFLLQFRDFYPDFILVYLEIDSIVRILNVRLVVLVSLFGKQTFL